MITKRIDKGYALTHEELDANFSEFDESKKAIVGLETYCPTGDKYIYSVDFRSNKNYALIGASPFQSGIMGSTTIPVAFQAVLNKSSNINHSGAIIPTDISNFAVGETLTPLFPTEFDTVTYLDISFTQPVDLIEIESDIVGKSLTLVKSLPYVDGFLIGDTTGLSTGVEYLAYGGEGDVEYIPFQLGTLQTIPATFNDLDPFGDGSQIHLFHFENNLIDGMGNANIQGTASFTTHVWSGSNALLLKNDAGLTLTPQTTDMLANGGWCVTTAFSRGSGTGVWYGDGGGFVYSHIKDILTWNDGSQENKILMYRELYGYVYDLEIIFVNDEVRLRPQDDRVESGSKVYHPSIPADPYEYAIGAYQVRYAGGKSYEYDTGWSRPYGVDFVYKLPEYELKDATTALPTGMTFDWPSLTAPNAIESEMDEMRIFNRPLNPLEIATVTLPAGETHPNITSTTSTEWGRKSSIGLIDINGAKQTIDIDIGGTLYSFGSATVDEVNNKITYQYKIAYGTLNLRLRINRPSNAWYGENFTIKGYRKI